MTPREQLREQTRETHAALERQPLMCRLMSPAVTWEDYAQFLGRLYAAYLPFCVHIDATVDRFALADMSPQEIPGFLHQDIQELGMAAPAPLPAAQLPQLGSDLEALGAWYVLEGAALGGAVVAKHLRRHLGEAVPLGYLAGRNIQSPRRWRRFNTHFSAVLSTPDLLPGICTGANTCYALTATAIDRPPGDGA